MNSALAFRGMYDSSCDFEKTLTPTSPKLAPIELSKEQIISQISDFYPESSNESEKQIFEQDLITEEITPAESGSSSIYFLKTNIKKGVAFNSLLKREGIVISINENNFTAKLTDLTHEAAEELADFPFDEISDDDKLLLEVGAVFYWNIGFKLLPSGQKERSSLIRFRRLPAWHYNEIENARKVADDLAAFFGW
jgi:hypothetical protein